MQRPTFSCSVIVLLATACGSDLPAPTHNNNWPADAAGPAGIGPGVRVYSGKAATLSVGRACTADDESDRWCAFLGLSSAGEFNLFVVNVSQAIAGVPVSCGAPDPNCLLLTSDARGSSADFHPTYFNGNTLVYYDRGYSAYVWRPGMDAGRLLAARTDTLNIAFCSPAPRGTAVACLAMPIEQEDPALIVAELYAGAADGESEPLLAPVDHVIVATEEDTEDVHRFGFGALADGYLAWSSRAEPDGPELLKLQHVDDPASQITVASDVHEWSVSEDGSTWFWIEGANELGYGTLQSAGFPDGAYPTDLLYSIFEYSLNRNGSLIALTSDTELVALRDPFGAPYDPVLLDSDIGRVLAVSDQGYITYTRRFLNGVFRDLVVSSLDGTSECVLDANGGYSQSSVRLSPGAGTLLWARMNTETRRYDAYHTRPADCSVAALSRDIVVLGWVGSGHAIFIEALDAGIGSGSLSFKKVGKDGEVQPEAATWIADRVDTYATWGDDFLVYTISTGTDENGLYVRAFGR
jgi:hypothetical protein